MDCKSLALMRLVMRITLGSLMTRSRERMFGWLSLLYRNRKSKLPSYYSDHCERLGTALWDDQFVVRWKDQNIKKYV